MFRSFWDWGVDERPARPPEAFGEEEGLSRSEAEAVSSFLSMSPPLSMNRVRFFVCPVVELVFFVFGIHLLLRFLQLERGSRCFVRVPGLLRLLLCLCRGFSLTFLRYGRRY